MEATLHNLGVHEHPVHLQNHICRLLDRYCALLSSDEFHCLL